jgi:hypothetical protein
VEPVIDREEAMLIMGMIGDIRTYLEEIRDALIDDGEEEEDT